MSDIFVPGAAEIHCGVGNSGALQFAGWSEAGVRISVQSFWEDVKSDLGGPMRATDVQRMGCQAFISLDLKIINWDTWFLIAGGGNDGIAAAGDTGTLMVGEDIAYRILVYRPKSQTKRNKALGMIPAYNFFAGWLAGPDDIDNSMRAMKQRCVFRAIETVDVATQQWSLYDHTFAGKPAAI